jgi:murein DD-endopeptidase MepM/ murein hydrolase activator NlpD
MRWFPFTLAAGTVLLATSALAQVFQAVPEKPSQGEVMKVTSDKAVSARMNGRTITLFPQQDGPALGLMPIPTLEKPGKYKLDFLDQGGAVLHSTEITVDDGYYAQENISIAPTISTLKPSPGEQSTVGKFRQTVSPERYWKEPFEAPLPGCTTSPFGSQRFHNGKPTGDFHAGVDQRGAEGAPIHPITPGIVKIVQKWNLRGGTVAIDHGQGVQTIYLHMSRFQATEGQHVEVNDVIGYVGATGRANGPHLHWTLYVNGVPVNPGQWMKLEPCPARVAPRPASPTAKKRKVAPAAPAPAASASTTPQE